jgi:hypothetical protein
MKRGERDRYREREREKERTAKVEVRAPILDISSIISTNYTVNTLHPKRIPPIDAISTAFAMNGERRKTFSSGSIPKNVEKRRRSDTFERSSVRSALEYLIIFFWYESSVLIFDKLL